MLHAHQNSTIYWHQCVPSILPLPISHSQASTPNSSFPVNCPMETVCKFVTSTCKAPAKTATETISIPCKDAQCPTTPTVTVRAPGKCAGCATDCGTKTVTKTKTYGCPVITATPTSDSLDTTITIGTLSIGFLKADVIGFEEEMILPSWDGALKSAVTVKYCYSLFNFIIFQSLLLRVLRLSKSVILRAVLSRLRSGGIYPGIFNQLLYDRDSIAQGALKHLDTSKCDCILKKDISKS